MNLVKPASRYKIKHEVHETRCNKTRLDGLIQKKLVSMEFKNERDDTLDS